MGKFTNVATGVTFSVDDSKDERYRDGYESANAPAPKKAAAKKSASSSKSEK